MLFNNRHHIVKSLIPNKNVVKFLSHQISEDKNINLSRVFSYIINK